MKKTTYCLIIIASIAAILSGCITSHTQQSFTLHSPESRNHHCRPIYRRAAVRVGYPRGIEGAMGTHIYYTTSDLKQSYYLYSEWNKPLSRILMKNLIGALYLSGSFGNILDYASTARADYILESVVHSFVHHIENDSSYADISIELRLMRNTGSIIKSKLFSYRIPIRNNNAEGFVHAANIAVGKLKRDMLKWLCGA